jgi:glycogen operon protein
MTEGDWNSPHIRCLGVVLIGRSSDVVDERGQVIEDASFMMLFNAHHAPVKFILAGREHVGWQRLLDTRDEAGFLAAPTDHRAGEEFEVESRSMCLFQLVLGTEQDARTAAWKPREKPAAGP